jgi:hypothetical protein
MGPLWSRRTTTTRTSAKTIRFPLGAARTSETAWLAGAGFRVRKYPFRHTVAHAMSRRDDGGAADQDAGTIPGVSQDQHGFAVVG